MRRRWFHLVQCDTNNPPNHQEQEDRSDNSSHFILTIGLKPPNG